MLERLFIAIVSVMVGVAQHIICKWLDKNSDN